MTEGTFDRDRMGASSEMKKTVARIDVIVGAGLVKQLNSVSAICPMLYWGSFQRCATASSATSGGV